MAKIKLEIISPNKVVYSADIDMLIVRSIAGDLGIMPKHAPLLAGLVPHAMRAMIDGTENLIAVSGGFIQVQPDKTKVLDPSPEWIPLPAIATASIPNKISNALISVMTTPKRLYRPIAAPMEQSTPVLPL